MDISSQWILFYIPTVASLELLILAVPDTVSYTNQFVLDIEIVTILYGTMTAISHFISRLAVSNSLFF